MLFNSYGFILVFLPLILLAFHSLAVKNWHRPAIAALTFGSLIFYGWWSVRGLILLLILMICNYWFTRLLIKTHAIGWRHARCILTVSLAFNLTVLAWFKYRNFFVDTLDQAFGLNWPLAAVFLPLGISFFTFQKIALLIDAYKGKIARIDWLDYALFVSFFPQLIAGPIVHHSEVMPQFHDRQKITAQQFATGLAIFVIGLAKKVVVADTMARFAGPVFDAAATGDPLSFAESWTAALAYTLQIYFDFSGYSDMAIGCASLFGIKLPLNFNSPYKAESIIDFWRRWHMTLSRFLRDYLYIPLGGNRHGALRRYVNLFVTMLLGGFWHGAGWTFLLWGALHGSCLTANHLWQAITCGRKVYGVSIIDRVLTFLVVVFGWVLFRAANIGAAMTMLHAMIGEGGVVSKSLIDIQSGLVLAAILLGLVWIAPNTQELVHGQPKAFQTAKSSWSITGRWGQIGAAALGALFGGSFLSLSRVTEFIYFQF